jgi:hypothetical protein
MWITFLFGGKKSVKSLDNGGTGGEGEGFVY